MDKHHGVDVGHDGYRLRPSGGAAGHHGTGGRGYVQCRSTEGASAVRVDLGSRSVEVAHGQSVGREERRDKLSRVTHITQAPREGV